MEHCPYQVSEGSRRLHVAKVRDYDPEWMWFLSRRHDLAENLLECLFSQYIKYFPHFLDHRLHQCIRTLIWNTAPYKWTYVMWPYVLVTTDKVINGWRDLSFDTRAARSSLLSPGIGKILLKEHDKNAEYSPELRHRWSASAGIFPVLSLDRKLQDHPDIPTETYSNNMVNDSSCLHASCADTENVPAGSKNQVPQLSLAVGSRLVVKDPCIWCKIDAILVPDLFDVGLGNFTGILNHPLTPKPSGRASFYWY